MTNDESTDRTSASAAPKPGPRPGPRPTPSAARVSPAPVTPATVPPAVSATHVSAAHHDPTRYGRIDESGVVWLKTTDGERQIGSWQAGTIEEGLAHFARRYDDLATEVEILEERLSSLTGDPRKSQTAAQHLLDSLPQAAVLGDVDALEKRLNAIVGSADKVADSLKAQREEARNAAIARKEQLALEAETIGAESTQWKSAGDRLRAILDEWKSIKGIDRKTDDALWKRYSKARDAFNRRRGAHFAELDRERAGAKSRKEELIARAEELSSSTDWGTTSIQFRELLNEWKAAGRAPRDTDELLWQRFKAAQDVFFAARNAATSERDAEFDANARAKSELLAEAERLIDPATDIDAARREFRAFRDKWEAIGKVPREQIHTLENRANALEKRIRDAEETQWQRADPEAQARAAQFAERAAQFEEQARKAADRGKTREAEKLLAQAAQWREWAHAAQSAINDR
ncbi:MAG: DUF349 domain-containing protein [Gordonia sp. (in: high G+C Gram-positive bacteria)]